MISSEIIFVTGYFGAPIVQTAEDIAKRRGFKLVLLDDLIEERDGRSIRRICMAGGEHGYRNLEYEAVTGLVDGTGLHEADAGLVDGTGPHEAVTELVDRAGVVVACGDGILYDDMTRDLILEHELIIVGEDLCNDLLWEGALQDKETWHAFMAWGSEEERRKGFEQYIERQRILFDQVRAVS